MGSAPCRTAFETSSVVTSGASSGSACDNARNHSTQRRARDALDASAARRTAVCMRSPPSDARSPTPLACPLGVAEQTEPSGGSLRCVGQNQQRGHNGAHPPRRPRPRAAASAHAPPRGRGSRGAIVRGPDDPVLIRVREHARVPTICGSTVGSAIRVRRPHDRPRPTRGLRRRRPGRPDCYTRILPFTCSSTTEPTSPVRRVLQITGVDSVVPVAS